MRTLCCTLALLLGTRAMAQIDAARPALIELKQDTPRPHAHLKLPRGHAVGPIIPGLKDGAVPQGLAFWAAHDWLLISCYFPHEGGTPARPSVVVALDTKTGKLVRCLTLVEANEKAHAGHVGGLAVSERYLWVGSGKLYRAALADVLAAQPVAHLRLQQPFQAECDASYVGYHDRRVWVGEFVSTADDRYRGKPSHYLKDRGGVGKPAWIVGYALDADENLRVSGAGKPRPPEAILGVRQHVQGMAFLDGHVVLSTSFGRTNDSALAAYTNPLLRERHKPHETVRVGDAKVPLWFLDGKNKAGKEIAFPPMCEGITACGNRLAAICESGAEIYQKNGRGPLDRVIFLDPPGGKD